MKKKFFFTQDSSWCTDPEALTRGCQYNYFYFRRVFEVEEEEAKIIIHVSASSRYNLYLDGQIVGRGPCRGDLQHYNYETYDIKVSRGCHVLYAHICDFRTKPSMMEGQQLALAEMSDGAAFLVAGGVFCGKKKIISLDTPGEWKSIADKAVSHRTPDSEYSLNTFAVIPPLENINFNLKIKRLEKINFDDSSWNKPVRLCPALLRGDLQNPVSRWWLQERQIPMMEENEEKFSRVHSVEGISKDLAEKWLEGEKLQIFQNTRITLDAGALNTAFPRFVFKGAKDAEVIIRYSEALFKDGKKMQLRDSAEGTVLGYSDSLILSGDEDVFEPFWFRTFRFLEIEIKIKQGQTLELNPPSYRTFMYPFKLKAHFDADDCEIRKIWEIGWRTARLCAHEHYYDCPYYEQLQYVGDTRIQALISYALTGDDRLGRQAIRHFNNSRLAEGITQSRYPSSWMQIIPGFSLYWIMMIKDHYDYFGDKDFVRELFSGVRAVLDWFESYRTKDGLIGHVPFWNFTDWLPEWPMGNPGRNLDKPLTINNLQYAYCCKIAVEFAKIAGENGDVYRRRAVKTINAVNELCWDRKSRLYVDMPGTEFLSQHTNSWAIIAEAVKDKEAKRIAREIKDNPKLSKATLYFKFYLFRAWEICRMPYFWDELADWKRQINYHLTTFPEVPDYPRSDCHAWSASPLFEFINCALGIKASANEDAIVIAPLPLPSAYQSISGYAPILNQVIKVKIEKDVREKFSIECKLKKPYRLKIIWPDGEVQITKIIKEFSASRVLC